MAGALKVIKSRRGYSLLMRVLLIILNFLAGLILTRFTISKFAAWPISVAGFEDMAKPLGIDPTFFRIGTGFIIGFAMLAYFANCLILILKKEQHEIYLRLFAFNSLYGTGAMIGALFAEFFLRTEVKWLLVYFAAGIIFVSLANLATHYKRISNTLRRDPPPPSAAS